MKIQQALFFFFAVLFFASCEIAPKINTTPSSTSLIGTWELTGLDYTGTSSVTVSGTDPFITDFTGELADSDFTIEFTDSPKDFFAMGDYSIKLTSEFGGITNVQTIPNPNYVSTGTWSIAGDQLTIVHSTDGPQTTTLINHTEESFQMVLDYNETQDQSGAIVNQQVDVIYSFKKLK